MTDDDRDEVGTGAEHDDDGDDCSDVLDVDDEVDGSSFEAVHLEKKKDIGLVLEITSFSPSSFLFLASHFWAPLG